MARSLTGLNSVLGPLSLSCLSDATLSKDDYQSQAKGTSFV